MRRWVSFWYRGFTFWYPGFKLVLAGALSWHPAAGALQGRAEIEARASAQGEQAARVLAEIEAGVLAVRVGAESGLGEQAPLRHAALAGVSVSAAAWEAALDARLAPRQAGADSLAAELAVRRELEAAAAALSISVQRSSWSRCASCAAQQLAAAGAAAEIEAPLPLALRGRARAAAYWLELRAGAAAPLAAQRARAAAALAPGPWDRFGSSTLQWPERWEVALSLARSWGALQASITSALGAPPQPGVLCARGGARLERALGRVTLGIGAALARLTPSGQVLAEATVSLGVRLGGVP